MPRKSRREIEFEAWLADQEALRLRDLKRERRLRLARERAIRRWFKGHPRMILTITTGDSYKMIDGDARLAWRLPRKHSDITLP